MDEKQAAAHLQRGITMLDLELPAGAIPDLLVYLQELQRWNQKMNLVAKKTSPEDILEKHFLDSLTLIGLMETQQSHTIHHLLDVGSGAGFPGLVLACARPQWQVHLVEPRHKRVSFLRHMVRTVRLENVKISNDRIENIEFPPTDNTHPSWICGRAVAEPAVFLRMTAHLMNGETRLLLMTAAPLAQNGTDWNPDNEYRLAACKRLTLPFSGSKRCLSVIEKR